MGREGKVHLFVLKSRNFSLQWAFVYPVKNTLTKSKKIDVGGNTGSLFQHIDTDFNVILNIYKSTTEEAK